jgi:hypothetical protein
MSVTIIIGLDPAGPLYYNTPASSRLDKDDAEYKNFKLTIFYIF